MTQRDELRERGRDLRSALGMGKWRGSELIPGLADLADEVVFGTVWSRPGLGLEDRMLATLSALSCKQYLPQLRGFVGAALHIGHPPRAIQEVMLHCGMYAGIPSAVNSLGVVAKVLEARELAPPDEDIEAVRLEELYERGLQTMDTLHADRARDGYAAPDAAAADLYDTAIGFLYGEIWNRPGLSTRQRMVCSVAAFTALQMETQQRKFFRSALNVGFSVAEVREVITQTAPYSGFPPALNALQIADEVLPAG